MPLSAIASCLTLFADCTSVRPESKLMTSCKPCTRAAAALAGQGLNPSGLRSNPGIRLADCTTLPAQNSAWPDIEIEGGKLAAPFIDCTASATRPAQPVPPEPNGLPACIAITWSACENRLVGTVDPARYCARVVG